MLHLNQVQFVRSILYGFIATIENATILRGSAIANDRNTIESKRVVV